jgi:hypothetical protein
MHYRNGARALESVVLQPQERPAGIADDSCDANVVSASAALQIFRVVDLQRRSKNVTRAAERVRKTSAQAAARRSALLYCERRVSLMDQASR